MGVRATWGRATAVPGPGRVVQTIGVAAGRVTVGAGRSPCNRTAVAGFGLASGWLRAALEKEANSRNMKRGKASILCALKLPLAFVTYDTYFGILFRTLGVEK